MQDHPGLGSRPRPLVRPLVMVGLVALLLAFAACSMVAPGAEPAGTTVGQGARSNDEGDVTVVATWAGPSAGPVFELSLDTHSVNLDGYDFAQLATLQVDARAAVQPVAWQSYGAGHHRGSRLTFPAVDLNGAPLITSDSREVVLVVRDVAGVPERVFRWTL